MASSQSRTDRARARWVGALTPLLGVLIAVLVAIVWGNPFGFRSRYAGAHGVLILLVPALMVLLAVGLPLAIAVESRPRAIAEGYAESLTSAAQLLAAGSAEGVVLGAAIMTRSTGLVTRECALWGPVARVCIFEHGMTIGRSSWPAFGGRLVPLPEGDLARCKSGSGC